MYVAWTTQRTSTLAELFVKPRSHEMHRLSVLDENYRFIPELALREYAANLGQSNCFNETPEYH